MSNIRKRILLLINEDTIHLVILLLASVLFIHLLSGFSKIFYTVILIIFFRSKRDYLYFVYIFILIQGPGGLFAKPYCNIFNLTPTVGIPFVYVFIVVAAVKYWNKLLKSRIRFAELRLILIYFFFLFIISFFYGISPRSVLVFIFAALSILFFFELPVFIPDKETFHKVTKLLFFSILLLFGFQLHDILFNPKIAILCRVTQGFYNINSPNQESGELVRTFWSGWISFITLFISLYHLSKFKDKYFSFNYLYLIACVSFLSVFLTATRGYILQYLFLIVMFLIISNRKSLGLILAVPLLLLIVTIIFPTFQKQLKMVVIRMNTLEDLYSGDETAGGTLTRLTERAPRVWNKYIENPLTGFGFSDQGYEYNDGHVGNYTLLVEGGLIGIIIYLFVIFSIVKRLFIDYVRNRNHLSNIIIAIAILSLIIAHSTSSIFFTYYFEPTLTGVMGIILLLIQREVY